MKFIINSTKDFESKGINIKAGTYAGIIESKYVFLVDGKDKDEERKATVVEFENKSIAHQTLEEVETTFPTGEFEVVEVLTKAEAKAKEAKDAEDAKSAKLAFAKAEEAEAKKKADEAKAKEAEVTTAGN